MKTKAITLVLIILFSLILWGSVSLNGEFVASVKIPIVFANVPEGYVVGERSVPEISLNVRGTGWNILGLIFSRNNEFAIPVGRVFGKHEYAVKNSLNLNSRMMASLTVLDIYPDKLDFTVERLTYKKVKLLPDLTLDYKEGFGLVSDIKVEPDSLMVAGPESQIKQLQFIKARPLAFDNLEQKISKNLTFDKPDKLEFATEDIKVEFDVQKIVEKTFDNIIVEQKGVPQAKELLIIPSKISVVLRGGINILGRMSNSEIKAYINFDDALNDKSGSIEPKIVVPNTVTIIDVKPKKLDYIIKHY